MFPVGKREPSLSRFLGTDVFSAKTPASNRRNPPTAPNIPNVFSGAWYSEARVLTGVKGTRKTITKKPLSRCSDYARFLLLLYFFY